MTKQCADCRDSEHDNLSDYVKLVFVRDLDTKKIVKRSYMCEQHMEMYLMDGYEVINCNTGQPEGTPGTVHKAY